LGIERSGLVAIVDDLEARGFLARVAVPGDRRVQALRPTKAGEAALAEMLAAVEDHEERLLGPLNEEERATLLGLLIKLRNHEGDGEA
jgi:DNA-binding MarR family transcriptional regulator